MFKLLSQKKALSFLLLLLAHSSFCQTLSTVAGNGKQGYSGDNGVAVNAMLNHPWGMAIDDLGNIYFADYVNSRVRKINASNGQITTIAGTGKNGYNGDNIDARSAQLNAPMSVAVDQQGNIYIADDGNYRVRKINANNGKITTVAGTGLHGYAGDGGPAANAQLGDPWHISVDGDNNLFITDYSNNCIRKVNALNGVITTVAGTGVGGYSGDEGLATKASLNLPVATAIDSYGNVFIADFNNNCIRKLDTETGIVTTVAGNGSYGRSTEGVRAVNAVLAYPGGVAIDGDDNVYFTDSDNERICKINASDGMISIIAGGGTGSDSLALSAKLNGPQAIALSSGNLYFSDTYDFKIKKINNVYKETPVKIVSFSATSSMEKLSLQWQISDKCNTNRYFMVQYSTDSLKWSTIKTVASIDRMNRNSYAQTVAAPTKAVNYYRLIAVNKYNDSVYSAIQKVDVELPDRSESSFVLYPNPVTQDFFTLKIATPLTSKIGFTITDLMGRKVLEGVIMSQVQVINVNRFSSGIYILKLSDGRTVKFKKI